jgi:beta-glucosidase
MQYGSRGSPEVTPFYTISPVAGITRQAGSAVKVNYVAEGRDETRHPIPTEAFAPASGSESHGLTAEYFAGSNLEGTPAATRNDKTINFEWAEHAKMNVAGINQHHFSVRWTGTLTAPETGRYEITFGADDGCRLFIDNKPVIDHWVSDPEPQIADVDLVAGKAYPFRAEYFQNGGKSFAHLSWQLPRINHCAAEVAAAKNADVAIVFVSTEKSEGEGHDRPSMKLSNQQDVLVQQVVAANPHTIVVLNNGTPVEMPWVDQVPGLIEAWFPGQEAGNAIASILFGTVNPSGKLPTTLGAHREDYPDYGNFPGVNGVVNYKEGIYVGYRHFDKDNITPLFPFGYGLSYTTFDYGALQVSSSTLDPSGKITVSLPIKNTGDREGREIVELYTHDPAPKIDKPVRELKGFAKVDLAPGETKTVTLQLTPRDLAYFDVPGKQWKADAGDYEIQVGASSRDIRQKATVHLSADFTQSVPLSSDQLTINGGFGKNTAVDQDDPTHF